MLPFLDKSAADSQRPAAFGIPPPAFRGLTEPTCIQSYTPVPYVRGEGQTTAHKIGLRYEAQVQDYLQSVLGNYDPTPVIRFTCNGLQRIAIPDAVQQRSTHTVVFEIKYTHCPEAWWQLRRLYEPLLRRRLGKAVTCVEVCRSYDPATLLPEPVVLIDDLQAWISEPRKEFGVFQWRKAD
jgi:hypothetical protein